MTKKITVSHFDGGTSEVDVEKLQWRPSAYGIVINDDSVLLLEQTNGYDLPGGGIDLGESIEDAVIREVMEETGLHIKKPTLAGVESSFYKAFGTRDIYRHAIMLYYNCELIGGDLSKAGFDQGEQKYAIGPTWVPLSELDSIKLGTSVDFRKYIKQVLA